MEAKVSTADGDIRYVPEEDAPNGGTFCSVAHESRYSWVIDRFDLKDKRVLDFGCGSGYGTAILAAQYAAAVVGTDISRAAIELCRSKYPQKNLQFIEADLERENVIELLDGKFDYIFSFDVIEHTERYFTFASNIAKLLAPDGIAVIGCPNRFQTFCFNKEWTPFHVQEFTPIQLSWLLSHYFSDHQLYGQDFVSKSLREKFIYVPEPKVTGIPKFLKKLRRSIRKRIFPGQPVNVNAPPRLLNKDIRFEILEADGAHVTEPFGLLAICRKPIC
jgi:2-polyprenyl-3-methyl-5-hydroxy-6-metoxy-1,4-benzoquinol methylase